MIQNPTLVAALFALIFPLGCSSQTSVSGTGGAGGDGGGAGATPGEGNLGSTCTVASGCGAGLACVFGYCRDACTEDTECATGSVCLYESTRGGCRLASETCSDTGTCANASLICGLDGTCRAACTENTCGAVTQRCIAGTCVSTVGEGSQRWGCGGVEDGAVACDGATLQVCNVVAPGLAELDTCGSAALCAKSVPADGLYDADAPPTCGSGCTPDQPYCDGARLLRCAEDGAGPLGEGELCATQGLCESAAADGLAACPAEACAVGEARCTGGEVETVVQRCSADQTRFDPVAYCSDTDVQCNPASGECFGLTIDEHEVTRADYAAFVAAAPDASTQSGACAWNTAFEADAGCLAETAVCAENCSAHPQVCVDWCDAAAYCAWRGQRLCGRIGGGMNPFERHADAGSSQWMNACSAGGQYLYAEGDTVPSGPTHCTYSGAQLGTTYAVGTRSGCHSPSPGYSHLMDLSGNVAEWEDSCELDANAETASATDACRTRGGSFDATLGALECSAVPARALARSEVSPSVGFRCCD